MTRWHVFEELSFEKSWFSAAQKKISNSKCKDFRKYNQIFSNKYGFDGHDKVKLRQFLSHFDMQFHFATIKYVFGVISSFRWRLIISMSANITYKVWPKGE
jgi:hypothetical protein